MPSNCLHYACEIAAIPGITTTNNLGWSIWCKNNAQKTTLMWANLASAVVYLTNATGGKRDSQNVYHSKNDVITAGRDLLRTLTDRNNGNYVSGLNNTPQQNDILVCGDINAPHYVIRRVVGADAYYEGQPGATDENYRASVTGIQLVQKTDEQGNSKSYNIRGYFR